ncbi:hypothetical protein BS50DRAFT_638061 [Corynespora cassiicola Philippines]|uniref:Extracellular membrane protein CFEM domain-containing protein n=1 Tax=Corynespora cassiicola Philippines TaxID=1448308 RepID=A0A2T2NAK4_CORCC|nr:hypothetical protein BS50DRAFT_638061 [Corynespora cassiicola Philippines]
MKLQIVLAGIVASMPLVAAQYSCQCFGRGTDPEPYSYIVAFKPCQEVGGTVCFNAAEDSNACITNQPWTNAQCKNWTGNVTTETVEASCVFHSAG